MAQLGLRLTGSPAADSTGAPVRLIKGGTHVIYSIIVGLVAGWLTGQVMKGGGYGVLMDIVLGLLGGVVGGWLFSSLGIWPGGGAVGAIAVAFVGAVILVALTRMLRRA